MSNTTAQAVIGSSFGDEGKGKIVDWLAHSLYEGRCTVVKFCGGSQAGHTVVTPEGKKRVFHHISSGTFAGADTYLSEHFICNPITFNAEINEFVTSERVIPPPTFVHPDAMVTTPYEMLINQMVETLRGKERHGSCGLGINETVIRDGYIRLRVSDLLDEQKVYQSLYFAKQNIVPRLTELLHRELPKDTPLLEIVNNAELNDRFLESCRAFLSRIHIVPYTFLRGKNIIFEGAQGLRLDSNSRYYPYVTNANTGLRNIIQIAENLNIAHVYPYYVTRCYVTRHGAGPLPYELLRLPYPKVEDRTNIPNEWQGELRYAYIDPVELFEFIYHDLDSNNAGNIGSRISPVSTLVMTCMDHLEGDTIKFIDKTDKHSRLELTTNFLSKDLDEYWSIDHMLFSTGPTRKDIKVYEELW